MPVLEDRSTAPDLVEVYLTAAPESLSLRPGVNSGVFAYNGRVPGPILEAYEGDSVVVHFRNELPEETTLHLHGLHLPFVSDGSPFHPVAPGGEYTYAFRVHPGSAGTYWYHPHPSHRTAYQVGMGLFGAIVIRDPNDPLPASLTERLLILSDNHFGPDGQIAFAQPGTRKARIDAMNGREGDVLFVNDAVMPTRTIRSGEVQRWRLINASGARIYRLVLEDHTFIHVGSDGGLFEHPQETKEIILSNGERAEVLVRGEAAPGTSVTLRTLPYDRYMPRTRPDDWKRPRDLLELQYTDEPPIDPVPIPERLRTVPRLDPDSASAFRTILLSQGRINGKTMDMERVDICTRLGATEVWEVENLVGMDHPFHLHGFQFQLLSRNGEPVDQPMWKDTVNLPKYSRARFVVRFEDYAGKWMFHCHILDHEDQGMMGVLEVK